MADSERLCSADRGGERRGAASLHNHLATWKLISFSRAGMKQKLFAQKLQGACANLRMRPLEVGITSLADTTLISPNL